MVTCHFSHSKLKPTLARTKLKVIKTYFLFKTGSRDGTKYIAKGAVDIPITMSS